MQKANSLAYLYNEMEKYLKQTEFFDFEHEVVQNFVKLHTKEANSLKEKAVELFKAVRDCWFYYPYNVYGNKDMLKTSAIMQREKGHCQDKACILVSCFRAIELPSRLHLAKVINHIAIENIESKFGSKELTPHASVQVFIENKWIDITPAFNKELCEKLGVHTLEFDGENDAMFQQFSKNGNQFMEYIEDYGGFEDYPYEFVRANLKEHYPQITWL